MKWKKHNPPKEGDERTIRRFAWKPRVIDNYTVWLETYQVTQKYFDNEGWIDFSEEALFVMY